MITVVVSINGRTIYARSARRIKTDTVNTYNVDDGRVLKHAAKDGALKLAIRMLEGVIEP